MACLYVMEPDGSVRTIKAAIGEVVHLPSGHSIVGSDNCGEPQAPVVNIEAELSTHGLKLGDAIAWVTHKLGIQQCAPCKARQEILNSIKELGVIETARRIKETLK